MCQCVIAPAGGNLSMDLSSVPEEPCSRTECISDYAITNTRYFISTTLNGCNNGCVYFLLAASKHGGKEFILPTMPC